MSETDPRNTYDWETVKKKVLKRDQHRCQACGMTESEFPGVDLHVHHIRAVEDGGDNQPENLVVLCKRCHNSVHMNGPENGEYPISIASDRTYAVTDFRDGYDPTPNQEHIIGVLKENGPTQKKDIKEDAGLEEWEFSRAIDHLMFARYVGRVERGVYGYIPREEYDRVTAEIDEGKDPRDVRYHAYNPDGEAEGRGGDDGN